MHKHHRVVYPMPSNIIYVSIRRSVNIYLRGSKDCASLKFGEKLHCLITHLFKMCNLNYACMIPGTRNNGGSVT